MTARYFSVTWMTPIPYSEHLTRIGASIKTCLFCILLGSIRNRPLQCNLKASSRHCLYSLMCRRACIHQFCYCFRFANLLFEVPYAPPLIAALFVLFLKYSNPNSVRNEDLWSKTEQNCNNVSLLLNYRWPHFDGDRLTAKHIDKLQFRWAVARRITVLWVCMV